MKEKLNLIFINVDDEDKLMLLIILKDYKKLVIKKDEFVSYIEHLGNRYGLRIKRNKESYTVWIWKIKNLKEV